MTVTERYCERHFTLNQISHGRQLEVRRILAKLDAYLPCALPEADATTIQGWMSDMIDDGLSPSSVRTYLQAIKPFYRWAALEGLIDRSQMLGIVELAPPRGAEVNAKPRPYSRAEIKRFWTDLATAYPLTDEQHLRRVHKGTAKYRGRAHDHAMRLQLEAICSLALFLGLRRQEIYTLSLDALHPDNAYVVVDGKREDHRPKVREVPYTDAARDAVRAWFRLRRTFNPGHDFTWLSLHYTTRDRPMSFTRFASLLTSFGPWEYHRLRHTCATERLRAGMPIEKLQHFLGHASIQQTLLYAKIETKDVIAATEKSDADFMRAIGRKEAA